MDSGSPDHIYYNATIINTSSDPRPDTFPYVTFSDNRSMPLISEISDYEFSVVRFTTEGPGKALPVFIPRIQLGTVTPLKGPSYSQRDPDLLIYSFGVGYQITFQMTLMGQVFYLPWEGYASRYVQFKSEYAGMSPPSPPDPYVDDNDNIVYPPYTTQDISTGYYSLSSIQSFLGLVNDTIARCVLTDNSSSNYMITPDLNSQALSFWNNRFVIGNMQDYYFGYAGVAVDNDGVTTNWGDFALVPVGTYTLEEMLVVCNASIRQTCLALNFSQELMRLSLDSNGHILMSMVPGPHAISFVRDQCQQGTPGYVFGLLLGSGGLDTIIFAGEPSKPMALPPQYNNPFPYPSELSIPSIVFPPLLKYDQGSNLFSAWGDFRTWRTDFATKATFGMNENSQELFSNFKYKWLGRPYEQTYELCFYDEPARQNRVTDPDGAVFMYVTQENESTSSLWCPVANITFCSTLIPTVAENEAPPLRIGAGNAQSFGIGVASNVSRIITDISVPKGSAYAYNGSLTFVPSGEYRITDFQGMGPLREIEVTIFWKCSLDGQLYPLPLPNGSIVTMKMMFRKKK